MVENSKIELTHHMHDHVLVGGFLRFTMCEGGSHEQSVSFRPQGTVLKHIVAGQTRRGSESVRALPSSRIKEPGRQGHQSLCHRDNRRAQGDWQSSGITSTGR